MMPATQEVMFAVLFSVVLVFNIAGNSLVMYIIRNERGMKTPTNYLLLNLAVADLLFGVFLAPEYILFPFFRHSVPDGVLGDWMCKILLGSNIALMASRVCIFTMVCLSVERYVAVCRPHTFRQRFSPKIVKVLVVVSWIYAAVIVSPIIVHTHLNREYNCSITKVTPIKVHSVYTLLEITCSLSLMIFFTVKIFISLWCKQTVEPTGEREITERKKKKKVTLCVLAVVVTFVVCWFPLTINYLLFGLSISPLLTAMILFASLNAALDPYLFSFQSSKFKALVKKVVCCGKESL
ncbi:allatostatin-A receptor-like [Actinia tenebrosa]|uniref:Allatostatin-A receptor-like n=1 Tax=Actinia tenebrosa TaxID=6105 RepID=A0A6P8IH53_ACTTE|nr:allatostatin-A receptor-like [Actinia tenebrosa]